MNKHTTFCVSALSLALVSALTHANQAQENQDDRLETIIVSGEALSLPNQVITDAKQPRQPLPAHDGADYLKTIPGFSMVRKGGASGDPVFRGMAASRLTILNDGNLLFGGCGSRMDPPTAYLSPQSFDQIRVIKGPQSVLHLPANATVLFERNSYQLSESGFTTDTSLTLASAGRREINTDMTLGNTSGFVRVNAAKAKADNYKDGEGNEINSHYDRWSANAELAWTPDADSLLMLSLGSSDGEAAYADRTMDGSLFDRRQLSLKGRKDNLADWLTRLEGQLYFNHVDHVMDNYSLRNFTPSMMMPTPAAMNPDRYNRGGRIQADLAFGKLQAKVGLDASQNTHRNRMSMNQPMMPYQDKTRLEDGRFEQWGLFTELSYAYSDSLSLHGGARVDDWQAWDSRLSLRKTMMITIANPSYGQKRSDTLTSGFVRMEQQSDNQTWYAGIGRAARFPDYWELLGNNRGGENSASAFNTEAEITHQLDVGWIRNWQDIRLSLSGYYADISDFVLLDKHNPMLPETVRNIDAHTFGGEASLTWQATPQWRVESSLAVSRGSNDSDNLPLAQQPPVELRLSTAYQWQDWQFGALWRLVQRQDKVAQNQGTIVGLDTLPTAGFGVLSANAMWQPNSQWQVSLGIDNLLDKQYQEYLSKSAADIPGYVVSGRVHEPGRTLWAKVDYRF